MGHFGKVVRGALQYPFTLACVIFSSLAVALLWGGNIGSVYPFVEVAFNGQSLHEWIDGKIDDSNARLAELEQQSPVDTTRIQAEREALEWYHWLRPGIREYTPASPFATLALVVALVVTGTLLKNVFLGTNLVLVERLAQSVTLGLRRQFFERTLKLDLGTLGQDHSADLMARFTHDMNFVSTALNSLFGRSVREPLKMLACLAGAAFICWRLLLLSLIAAPLAALIIGTLARSIKRANRRAMEEMNGMYGVLSEVLGGIEVVKAYTMERYEIRRFDQASRRYMRRVMRIVLYNALLRPATEIMGIAAICLAILAGGYLVLNQQTHLAGIPISNRPLDRGALMTFFALLIGASDPARKLADVYGAIQRGIAACERIFDRMQRQPQVVEAEPAKLLPRPLAQIEFDKISFGYHPQKVVLRDVSLTIEQDETIAIVGPNGCGKSTLANLIPRFYDPQQGSVRINGIDLREVSLRDLRRSIALVTQRTVLFDDTVLENMRYGAPGASLEEVIAAAKQAHIHEFVSQLPQGYETRVGEAGNQLSGGQRQRIALTRAILRRPEILILDEATSQIDPESERAIHAALSEFVRGRMTIMVTHRATTLPLASRVVVMDRGTVVDHGDPVAVHARCELFQRLFPTLSLPTPSSANADLPDRQSA